MRRRDREDVLTLAALCLTIAFGLVVLWAVGAL